MPLLVRPTIEGQAPTACGTRTTLRWLHAEPSSEEHSWIVRSRPAPVNATQTRVVWVAVALGREAVTGQPLNSACAGVQSLPSKVLCQSRSSSPSPFQYKCSPLCAATSEGPWLDAAPGTGRGSLQRPPSNTAHQIVARNRPVPAVRQAMYSSPCHAARVGFSRDAAPGTRR